MHAGWIFSDNAEVVATLAKVLVCVAIVGDGVNAVQSEPYPKKQRHGMRASRQVRRAFLDMLAAWLLELPDRDEHRPRLLPYLLAALADPVPALAAAAAAALEALGAQYERDHAAELKACHKAIVSFASLKNVMLAYVKAQAFHQQVGFGK